MKKIINLLFLFIGIMNWGISQENVAVETIQDSPINPNNSLLWEISGNDLEAPSYLFGTIHMIGKDDFFLTDETKKAIDKSELVTFEINMEDMMNISSQFSLLTKAFMADNLTLKDLLTEEEYKIVQQHFAKIGIPLFFFERIKPMFLTVMASGDLSGDAMSTGEIVSYEMEIMEIAKKDDKEIGGLETAEFQMSMFDSIPYKAQAKMLIESIQAEEGDNDQFAEMVELYKNQDLVGMSTMISSEEGGLDGYEDLLLVTRNKNWIPIMGEMMLKQTTFFAVGAGHLGGEMGVIELLRKEGYELKPLRD